MILMSLSNQHGHLVLATGNKSELAVGYSTIYGDAVGGYAPIKDVFKTGVGARPLAQRRGAERAARPPIPENSITKPPSAELRPGQLDTDSLPAYEVLDALLERYVERDLGARRAGRRGLRPGAGRAGAAARRPRRVQATPVPARAQGRAAQLRARPARCR